MANDVSENMVLRTVYLPKDLDQKLKAAAFRDAKSKNDLIRELIQTGISTQVANGDKRFSVLEPKAGRKPVAVQPTARKSDGASAAQKRVRKARLAVRKAASA